MGGYGTWALATEYPELFAAIAPICGGCKPGKCKNLKSMPVWVFHGAEDMVVPLSESQKVVDELRSIGNEPRFTVYENTGHDSWTETYNNDELYTWLMSQRK
jgi:predicted peptidase